MTVNSVQERTARSASTFNLKPTRNSNHRNNNGVMTPPTVTSMEDLLVYAAYENTVAAVEAERRRVSALLKSNVVESLNLMADLSKMCNDGNYVIIGS